MSKQRDFINITSPEEVIMSIRESTLLQTEETRATCQLCFYLGGKNSSTLDWKHSIRALTSCLFDPDPSTVSHHNMWTLFLTFASKLSDHVVSDITKRSALIRRKHLSLLLCSLLFCIYNRIQYDLILFFIDFALLFYVCVIAFYWIILIYVFTTPSCLHFGNFF